MDGQGSRGEQLGKLRAEREAKAIMPGKLRAEREAKAIMKLAGRDKSHGPDRSQIIHLKESESSKEYTAGSCREQHSWTGAPPTGGGVVGAGKCRRHADGHETVTFGPASLSPPLGEENWYLAHLLSSISCEQF
ncbi:hypothetical protein THAOC_29136 [Thalassiosira oceanica]|uniref:Uncharacterized protein n=1 Tax=Thalassiosira oceanica TaxID=159749 RepID=K0RHC9_THAOC|nr:hypothetical protein THAOC_29136 [Thalassiosira oceanica]|eukprot:EJK51669.1 hypothetical protein THAOC_29136 [Thalassiosira oceanica]